MTVHAYWYGLALAHAWGGVNAGDTQYFIDYLSDPIKVMLCTASYTPSQDTHAFKSDVTGEVTGAGYTARGATLSSKTLGYTSATKVLKFADAATLVWSGAVASSGSPAAYAVIYKDTGTDSTSPLMGYVDFSGATAYSNSTGTFTITWSSSGIFTITLG
jgi:hypothetical protein